MRSIAALCLTTTLLACGGEVDSSAPSSAVADDPPRTLRLAVAQMASENGALARNLAHASGLVATAASQGAQLVVFPEFMPPGYSLDTDAWEAAEARGGPTERWLAREAASHGLFVGTSYLEADGEHFYNTFALADPDGRIVGRVRKSVPAGFEGRLFRGDPGMRVIETSIGRIGVGICQESYRCFLAQALHEGGAQVVLLPHSYPDLSASGGLGSPPGRFVATWYAEQLGVPVAMVNKVGDWHSLLSDGQTEVRGRFPGQSAIVDIVDGEGQVLVEMDEQEGVAMATVRSSDRAVREPDYACTGPFVDDLTLGGFWERLLTRMWIRAVYWLGLESIEDRVRDAYENDPERPARARVAAEKNRATAAAINPQDETVQSSSDPLIADSTSQGAVHDSVHRESSRQGDEPPAE